MSSQDIANEFCSVSAELLDQSMIKITHCLGQLNEEQVWWRPRPSMNSIGNLCVHIAGNLRQWGIVPFEDAPDQREREREFSAELQIPTTELTGDLAAVVSDAKKIWLALGSDRLLESTNIQGFEVTHMHAISHTSGHFVGHAHQIISLTRIQKGEEYRFQWSPENDRDNVPI